MHRHHEDSRTTRQGPLAGQRQFRPESGGEQGLRPGLALRRPLRAEARSRRRDRDYFFGRTVSTAAVHDGLVYAAELDGFLHCLDAQTGKEYWDHDLDGDTWSSPYYVDGKVYMGVDNGDLFIFKAGKDDKEPIKIEMQQSMKVPPVAANGVLYVNNGLNLYAIDHEVIRPDLRWNGNVSSRSVNPDRRRDPRSGPPGPRTTRRPRPRDRRSGTSTPRPARRSGWRRPSRYKFDPLKDVKGFDDLKMFGLFEDEWLRGGPVRRWVPKALAEQADLRLRDRRHDRHPQEPRRVGRLPHRLRDVQRNAAGEVFSQGGELADARPVRPAAAAAGRRASGPASRRHLLLRRPRPALGGQAHQEGLDGAPESLPGARHRPGDDGPVGRARRQVHVHDAETARRAGPAAGEGGSSIAKAGITGIFCGGTEMTSQWMRFTIEEYLAADVYITPTYGNTLMGLAAADMPTAEDNYKIAYYAPQPRAVVQVVEFDDYDKVVDYGKTGRVLLTTLTKEFFVPRFAERDEGEREQPTASIRGTASAACGRSTNSRRRRRWGYTEEEGMRLASRKSSKGPLSRLS